MLAGYGCDTRQNAGDGQNRNLVVPAGLQSHSVQDASERLELRPNATIVKLHSNTTGISNNLAAGMRRYDTAIDSVIIGYVCEPNCRPPS